VNVIIVKASENLGSHLTTLLPGRHRCSRMKGELLPRLKYTTFDEGLKLLEVRLWALSLG
jgi:hypothetical protein